MPRSRPEFEPDEKELIKSLLPDLDLDNLSEDDYCLIYETACEKDAMEVNAHLDSWTYTMILCCEIIRKTAPFLEPDPDRWYTYYKLV